MAYKSKLDSYYRILDDLIDDSILKEESFVNGDEDSPFDVDIIKKTNKRMYYTFEEKLLFIGC